MAIIEGVSPEMAPSGLSSGHPHSVQKLAESKQALRPQQSCSWMKATFAGSPLPLPLPRPFHHALLDKHLIIG